MMPAAKHLDPVIGADVHIILIPTPAGPLPTPIPHPYVGMIFDATDYIPKIGATVFINGLPRATAGTAGTSLPPHIPMGGPFAKPPSSESEMFMGSSTVITEGEPMSYAALPVLSCQDVGMPAPFRLNKKSLPKSLLLPTSTVMPIPAGPPVLIGGAPTVSMPGPELLIGPLAKGMFKSLSKAAKAVAPLGRKIKKFSDTMHRIGDAVLDKLKIGKESALRNKVHRSICTVTGHPVDVASGKLFTDFVDLTLPGPMPYKLQRVWYSTSTYVGPLGHGWHASFDMALARSDNATGVRLGDGRTVLFPLLEAGASHFDESARMTLTRDEHGYALQDVDGITHRFATVRAQRDVLPLVELRDRNGFAIRFQHDDRARLARIVDSGGRPWELEYEGNRIAAVLGLDPRNPEQGIRHVGYAYDDRGNLCEVRNALGEAQRFSYQRQLLVKETNRNGLSFYFQYDGRDDRARCTRTWGDGGIYDHKLTYEEGRTTVENSLGHKTTYLHDGAMVHKTIDAYGNTTETTYGDGYRVTMERDELGQATLFKYDERGNLIESLGPDGANVSMEYGPHDLPVRAVDVMEGVWIWNRDELGRVVERTDPLGRVTRYRHNGPWLVGIVDPAGGLTALGYDRTGNVDAIATPDHRVTRYAHDALGRVVGVQDPKGNIQRRALDLLGRVVRVDEPDGNVRDLAYDREGNVVHARDMHHDVRFTYQGMNRLTSRTEANTTVRFSYDTEEQLTGIVNEHGRVYRFVLGPTGGVDEEHGFDGILRTYTRDRAGRVTRVNRPGGRWSTYAYDAGGRVTEVKHSDGTAARYGYRLDGALTSASNQDASITFERDALGRVLRESRGEHWVESAYDLRGMRTRVRSCKGLDQIIERDLMGDVSRVRAGGFEAHFTRDELGLELERALPGGLRSTWQRDKLGRPTQHAVSGEAGLLRAVGYKWEPNDRLRMLIDGTQGATEYRHDALGNLAWARYPDGSFDLRMPDAVGNLFRREDRADRRYGPAGQLLAQSTARGEIRYAYDREGNLVEKREPNGSVWRYEWNGAGMLAKVIRPDLSEVTFAYDALGRRIKKSYRGQTTHWIWDGNNPLHEWVEGKLKPLRDENGVALPWSADPLAKKREAELQALLAQGPPERGAKDAPITWLFEPESFSPMAKLVGDRQFSIITDHLGTPVLMADATGARVWSAGISAYGELRGLEGERFACPFRWPGQYEDAETGLYYNRFRYYDAKAGQYTSPDPIGLAGGLRARAYVRDPLTWTDPRGLSQKCMTSGKPRPPRVSPGALPAEEEAAVLETLRHVDAGTVPTGKTKKKWGTSFHNKGGDLPGNPGSGGYKEYRVSPAPGEAGAGARRIVIDDSDGSAYYTWTHYGDSGAPAFVQIR